MMTEKILQCPYCGDNVNIKVSANPSQVWCESCGAEGPEALDHSDAILLWNAAANALAKKDESIARLEEQYEKEYTKLFATMRKIDVLERNLIETTDRAVIAEVQRDEARKVAQVWYNAAGVLKVKHDEYKLAYQTLYAMVKIGARTEPQTIRVETTDKETP